MIGRPTRSRAVVAVVSLVAAMACGHDAATGPKRVDASVRAVAGADVTDTVLAAPVQAVVVEVRDTLGRVVPGVIVRFEAAPSSVPNRYYETPLYVCAVQQSSCGGEYSVMSTSVAVTTGENGRASATIRLGTIAGPTWLYLVVPDLGLRDSARFTVLPGKVARIGLTVADTTVSIGATYSLGAAPLDRFGNAAPGALSYSARSTSASVTTAGVVTAAAVGRDTVTVSGGGLASVQAYVSVVPSGTLVASGYDGVYVVNLDGSGRRRVSAHNSYLDGFAPAWSPDGTRLVFHGDQPGSPYYQSMVISVPATATNVAGSMLPDASVNMGVWPRYSADGAYVYFSGSPADGHAITLYRVRSDGTQTEQLLTPSDSGIDWRSAPSPDGTKLVYVTSRTGMGAMIRIFDIASRTAVDPRVAGQTPRWSPDGSAIAYVDVGGGALRLMNPDGSGQRIVSKPGTRYGEGFDWSPDGKWIIANDSEGLVLVSVATGDAIPLRGAALGGLYQPSWKR